MTTAADAYHQAAQRHRPTDGDALAREARRLASTGLTPSDVATALRLPLAWVTEVICRGEP